MSMSQSRPTDSILEELNRMSDAKLTGALGKTEFSKLLSDVGDLVANRIVQGKLSNDSLEQIEAYVTCFDSKNGDYYFDFKHENLQGSAKAFLEGMDVAVAQREQRMMNAAPVSNGFSLGLKRLN